jgi:hypothetical protein
MRISRVCTELRHAVHAGQPLEDFLRSPDHGHAEVKRRAVFWGGVGY